MVESEVTASDKPMSVTEVGAKLSDLFFSSIGEEGMAEVETLIATRDAQLLAPLKAQLAALQELKRAALACIPEWEAMEITPDKLPDDNEFASALVRATYAVKELEKQDGK